MPFQLRDVLSLTNVAGNLPNIRRNAEALVAMLEKRGAKAQILGAAASARIPKGPATP